MNHLTSFPQQPHEVGASISTISWKETESAEGPLFKWALLELEHRMSD